MGLSQSRANSAATNAAYHLRAAVTVREIAEQREKYDAYQRGEVVWAAAPNYEVIGTCGHRIDVIGHHDARRLVDEASKINDGKPRRRRCIYCPKSPEADAT